MIGLPTDVGDAKAFVSSSVTVPSGETWAAWVSNPPGGSGDNYVEIDQQRIYFANDGGGQAVAPVRVLLIEGTTVTGPNDFYLQAFDISNLLSDMGITAIQNTGSDVTVPSGETWNVWVTGNGGMNVNQTEVYNVSTNTSGVNGRNEPSRFILPAGTDIANNGVHISGFDISSLNPDPFMFQLLSGESTTVPSGETWWLFMNNNSSGGSITNANGDSTDVFQPGSGIASGHSIPYIIPEGFEISPEYSYTDLNISGVKL